MVMMPEVRPKDTPTRTEWVNRRIGHEGATSWPPRAGSGRVSDSSGAELRWPSRREAALFGG